MTAANVDRSAQRRQGLLQGVPVAANTRIFGGTIVVTNAGGFGVPATTALGLTVLGVADDAADNRAGANGDRLVFVQRRQSVKVMNFAGDPVGQAQLGKMAYLVDDQTVAATNGGGVGTRSAAGVVDGVEADGVWIYFA